MVLLAQEGVVLLGVALLVPDNAILIGLVDSGGCGLDYS